MLHSVFATSCPGCFFRWPFSSALAFAPVRFKSCSCLYSSRCLRTCAHPSTSPAALTDRSEIASTLPLSLSALNPASTRPDLAHVRLRAPGPYNIFLPPSIPNAAPAARSVPFPYHNTIPCFTALYLCVASYYADKLRQRSPVSTTQTYTVLLCLSVCQSRTALIS